MRAIVIVSTLMLCLVLNQSVLAQETARAIQTLTYQEFLQLPEGAQSVYVAGIIDGESFMLHGRSDPSYPEWGRCVQKTR